MKDALIVLTTTDGQDDAERMAQLLVERRLAGCVSIVPHIASIYRWQGEVQRAEEWLLVIKTTKKAYPNLERTIREVHRYSVPEVIALPVERVSDSYLAWLATAVDGST